MEPEKVVLGRKALVAVSAADADQNLHWVGTRIESLELVLMTGPPDAGKTLSACAMLSIPPSMSID